MFTMPRRRMTGISATLLLCGVRRVRSSRVRSSDDLVKQTRASDQEMWRAGRIVHVHAGSPTSVYSITTPAATSNLTSKEDSPSEVGPVG